MTKAIENDLKDKKNEMELKERKALEFYQFLKDNDCILFEAITGSQAHGTSTPESDVDKSFVYILPKEYLYGLDFEYKEQIRVNADYTGFEIHRFLMLAHTNNPTILELFYSPEDCIISMHPTYQHAIDIRDSILTKRCRDSFAGYAKKQIIKAKGLDKMQNWERSENAINRVIKKEPIDFCYLIDKEHGYKTMPLTEYLKEGTWELDQKFLGISKVANFRDAYALFYDYKADNCFNEYHSEEHREANKKYYKEQGQTVGLGYKGLQKSGEGKSISESNQLRLSSIPKGEFLFGIIGYNQDGYTKHCKDYKSYQTWLENRNEQRYVDNKEHGQSYDGKNLMHCKRLLQIAREIAETGTMTIRRPNREELLDIRKGKIELGELISWAESEMNDLRVLFDESNLPDDVPTELINETLIKIRKDFYEGNFEVVREIKQIERHGNLSTFQTMLRNAVMEKFPKPYYCDSFAKKCKLVTNDDGSRYPGYIDLFDAIELNKWPQCKEEDTGELEDIVFENTVIFGITEDKLTLGGGGDWQVGAIFDIVQHEGGFTAVNERETGWDDDRFEAGDLFVWLDIPVIDKFEEE